MDLLRTIVSPLLGARIRLRNKLMRRRNKSSGSLEEAAHQTAQAIVGENSQPDTSTGTSSDLEARLANAEAHRADAQRVNESYVASTSDLEARLMNAEARRADAQRRNESYVALIGNVETRLVNAESRLADAQQMNQKYHDLIVDLEARLANADASGLGFQ